MTYKEFKNLMKYKNFFVMAPIYSAQLPSAYQLVDVKGKANGSMLLPIIKNSKWLYVDWDMGGSILVEGYKDKHANYRVSSILFVKSDYSDPFICTLKDPKSVLFTLLNSLI